MLHPLALSMIRLPRELIRYQEYSLCFLPVLRVSAALHSQLKNFLKIT